MIYAYWNSFNIEMVISSCWCYWPS